jgi:hypothetical protein
MASTSRRFSREQKDVRVAIWQSGSWRRSESVGEPDAVQAWSVAGRNDARRQLGALCLVPILVDIAMSAFQERCLPAAPCAPDPAGRRAPSRACIAMKSLFESAW